VDQSALTLSQNLMYAFKTKRQVQHQPKQTTVTFRTQRHWENPQVVGLALSTHHETRNKKLLDLLHSQNFCVSYGWTLLLETAIANAVVENALKFDGVYVPPFLKKERLYSLWLTIRTLPSKQLMAKATHVGLSL